MKARILKLIRNVLISIVALVLVAVGGGAAYTTLLFYCTASKVYCPSMDPCYDLPVSMVNNYDLCTIPMWIVHKVSPGATAHMLFICQQCFELPPAVPSDDV